MTDITPPLSDRPAHYRLKAGTWEVILKEYVEGATAPELALKWRVSEHALRKRITQHEATKRDHGDAQAIIQAAMRADALAEAKANDPEARAARLFDGVELDDAEADAGVLARAATLTSGRAMKGRLWAEAKALVGLAESYGRMAEREAKMVGAGRVTIETMDLQLLYDILFVEKGKVIDRFTVDPDNPGGEDGELKARFWRQWYLPDQLLRHVKVKGDRRAWQLERQIREMGGEPEPEPATPETPKAE